MRGVIGRISRKLLAIRLSPVARAIRKDNLTYLSSAKLVHLERALRWVRSAGVGGAYLEFGVALGGSAILIAHAARERAEFLDLTSLDLYSPTSQKDDEKSRDRYRTIASGVSSGIGGETCYGYRADLFGDVVRAFRRHGLEVDGDKVRIDRGLFQETWPTLNINRVGFCHIDCDWYDPVKFCLGVVGPCWITVA